ncbi:MAG: hypothetical protein HY512_02875 [Candidatus Aenigmarchaeota archaeon]|nr:hypothetical protein [Candidatus Aenigmarchaeota archaeon]
MRKIIYPVFAALLSLMPAGPSVEVDRPPIEIGAIDPISGNKIYPISELRVDNTGYQKTYVGSEEEGIKMMMDAAIDSPDEDAWLQCDVNGKTYFVDIGSSPITKESFFKIEVTESGRALIRPEPFAALIHYDMAELRRIVGRLPKRSSVRNYHIHPATPGGFVPCGEGGLEYVTTPSPVDIGNEDTDFKQMERANPDATVLPSRVVGAIGYSEVSADNRQGFFYKKLRSIPERLAEKLKKIEEEMETRIKSRDN